jgi:hypothetical protein
VTIVVVSRKFDVNLRKTARRGADLFTSLSFFATLLFFLKGAFKKLVLKTNKIKIF